DFLAVLIVIAARLQAAFDVDLFALGQIRRDVLPAPQDAIGPVGFFLPLTACLILPTAVGGDGKLGHRRLRGGISGLGVPSEMPDESDFVDASASHDLRIPFAK